MKVHEEPSSKQLRKGQEKVGRRKSSKTS